MEPVKKILVVDDDFINCRVVSVMLDKLGHFVDTALSGKDALSLLCQEHYSLVFMDYQMPDMDGATVTRLLRTPDTNTINPTVPVIALTADCVENVRERCHASGMNDILSKPLKYGELEQVLKSWL